MPLEAAAFSRSTTSDHSATCQVQQRGGHSFASALPVVAISGGPPVAKSAFANIRAHFTMAAWLPLPTGWMKSSSSMKAKTKAARVMFRSTEAKGMH